MLSSNVFSDIICLIPQRISDQRGFFSESWNKRILEKEGIYTNFVQDNHSVSLKVGTLRGLHFQKPPHAQVKLVRCGRGRIFDVVVDIRKGSPTFGGSFGQELSFENGKQLFIPVGFMHGFVTLESNTEIVYKCSDYYSPDCDRVVRFDDPDLAIKWPMDTANAIFSEKDSRAPFFKEFDSPFVYKV